ncbi:hypothetical protein E7811_14735 [Aliigemmobacter aestuarii]|uniref:FMN-dependent dehydrogenase domain-containing protein n=1 Tax=Aliigemmobacter aestuarii TaxID=1445661 RepID=A0A4V3V074_9RHOB|nr:hypothetical protein E7811_14735 [Gemmobacter aestuarii]
MLSNRGGCQIDGFCPPFDGLAGVLDTTAGQSEVIMPSGIRRSARIVKAVAMGTKATGIGRGSCLFPLAAAGKAAVETMPGLLKGEVTRGIRPMGAALMAGPGPDNLRFP